MKIKINLREKDRWRSGGGVMARGCAYREGVRLEAAGLCGAFGKVNGKAVFAEISKSLNGFFAVICVKDQEIYAAVDQVRSIPLFYAVRNDDTILISDDAFWIKTELAVTHRNIVAEEEFVLLGYTTGPDTLWNEIRQIQAGEIICFAEGQSAIQVDAAFYTRYIHHYEQYPDTAALTNKFDQVLANVAGRMIDYAAGRQILLPLSGGLDSRLLALLLKRYRYESVATFSYGNIHSEESTISKAIADGLGLPWLFVPYSNASWKAWFHSPEFRAYKQTAFQLSSCVHVQDFPAIWELKRKNVVSADAVIMPGICADLQAGSMSKDHRRDLYHPGPIDREHVISSIIDQHYNLFEWSKRRAELYPQFSARIAAFLGEMSAYPDAASAFEAQFCAEKVAKYLVNSVRAYEFWDFDWWLPYWDDEFIRFWTTVPLMYRIDKTFYNGYVKNLQNKLMPALDGKVIGRDHNAWWWTLRKLARRTVLNHFDRFAAPVMKKWFVGQQDEFAWFGIMNKKQFWQWYTGHESIQSALVLEYLGRLTIAP